ncbi:MAG TPA: hypothetical protein VJ813_10470 [Vicinamibacterales bacterium]|nr:hypothetical protein [Vicinamibacterales bacterium]
MRAITTVSLAGLVLLSTAAAGCQREPEVPAAQTQTQASSPANQPATVIGCLRAGDAEGTYVVTTAQTVDGAPAATYELAGDAGVNLQDHVGRRVEVTGVIDQQSQVATRQSAQPADNATGTAGKPGTPTVQTGTQLSIKRLEVKAVKRTGGDCEL